MDARRIKDQESIRHKDPDAIKKQWQLLHFIGDGVYGIFDERVNRASRQCRGAGSGYLAQLT